MYRTIIEIKEDTPKETLEEIKELCIAAHKNRAGEVKLKPISDYSFAFEGEEKDYGCLQLGYLALGELFIFRKNVKKCKWEDEEPDESCDLLEIFSRHIRVKGGINGKRAKTSIV